MSQIATPEEVTDFRNAIGVLFPENYTNCGEPLNCIGLSLVTMAGAFLKTGQIPMIRMVFGGPESSQEIKNRINFAHLYVLADPKTYGIPDSRGIRCYSQGLTTSLDTNYYPELEPEVVEKYPDYRREILSGANRNPEKPENIWLRTNPEYLGLTAGPRLEMRTASLLYALANKLGILIV